MAISQNTIISVSDVFKEIANRTGFIQYSGFIGINRIITGPYQYADYTFEYYSTDITYTRDLYPQMPSFVWIRNSSIPNVTSYIWEWNFDKNLPSPFNSVSIFQVVIFSNDDNVRIYINDSTNPVVTISYNTGRSSLAVWTWNTVYYARIELDNSGGQMNALEMGVYYQF